MSVYIFPEDLGDVLDALGQANQRAIDRSISFGASPVLMRLVASVYAGALADVGTAFGLDSVLIIPVREEVMTDETRGVDHRRGTSI